MLLTYVSLLNRYLEPENGGGGDLQSSATYNGGNAVYVGLSRQFMSYMVSSALRGVAPSGA